MYTNQDYYYQQSNNLVAGNRPTNMTVISTEGIQRRVYINRDFQHRNAPAPATTTVLVNPNFKRQVHINPNFQTKKNVYVNPSIFKGSLNFDVNAGNININDTNQLNVVNVIQPTVLNHEFKTSVTVTKEAKAVKEMKPVFKPIVKQYSKINVSTKHHSPKKLSQPLVKTRNKIIRVPMKPEIKLKSPNKPVFSKYKIIRNRGSVPTQSINVSKNKFKLDRRTSIKKVLMNLKPQREIIKKSNKFKLDRRNEPKKSYKFVPKVIPHNRFTTKSYLLNLDPKTEIIKRTKAKMVKINGSVYKLSANYESMQLLYRNPNKYEAKKQICYKGEIYLAKNSVTFVKRRKSVVKINRNALKKDNMPCLIYRKTGKCDKMKTGNCIKRHNLDEISICTRFLQGACINKSCLLSHKVSAEKMPTCKFYLEGLCHNESCPYLHIKLSKNAEICKSFLLGYCENGVNCNKRHQFLCPYFEQRGKCHKKNCIYPHGNQVRQYKNDRILNKIARSTKTRNEKKIPTKKVIKTKPTVDDAEQLNKRYFDNDNGNENTIERTDDSSFLTRPKLGSLPTYIPL